MSFLFFLCVPAHRVMTSCRRLTSVVELLNSECDGVDGHDGQSVIASHHVPI